jgi:hypothetical protein
MIEDADQAKQRAVGHRLIPMIESDPERSLAPHKADDRTENDGHPQQRGKASAEADAAERRENNQDHRSQEKANQHLGRTQFSRQIRELRQDLKNSGNRWFAA